MIDSPFSRGRLAVIALGVAAGTGAGILVAPLIPWLNQRGGAIATIIIGILIVLGVLHDATTENSTGIRSLVTSFFTGYVVALLLFKIFEPGIIVGGVIAITISFLLAPRIP